MSWSRTCCGTPQSANTSQPSAKPMLCFARNCGADLTNPATSSCRQPWFRLSNSSRYFICSPVVKVSPSRAAVTRSMSSCAATILVVEIGNVRINFGGHQGGGHVGAPHHLLVGYSDWLLLKMTFIGGRPDSETPCSIGPHRHAAEHSASDCVCLRFMLRWNMSEISVIVSGS